VKGLVQAEFQLLGVHPRYLSFVNFSQRALLGIKSMGFVVVQEDLGILKNKGIKDSGYVAD
jgi:hypothetical protein